MPKNILIIKEVPPPVLLPCSKEPVGDLDFLAVFLRENHVQASQMSHPLEIYSGF